ncbi:MAG: DUF1080 domain-containing protein [Planctomycetota bacterium]|nr:MAG: DUF1080 domain-containing protein [Planctomycetota bacterium]
MLNSTHPGFPRRAAGGGTPRFRNVERCQGAPAINDASFSPVPAKEPGERASRRRCHAGHAFALLLAAALGALAVKASGADSAPGTQKSAKSKKTVRECVPALPAVKNAHRPVTASEPGQPGSTRDRRDPACLSLFDGKSLAGWKSTPFGGEGDVYVRDGQIILETGSDLTGITWTRPELLPKTNYEVELDAMRVDGSDFFCGLTFPVGKDPCTLILGGWGGGVCGLSSLDGFDASENETTTYKEFKNKRWYHVRLRVTPERITAWLDGEELVDVDIRKRQIGIRPEVDLSRPFGIASWQTTAALKNIVVRKLPAAGKKHAKPNAGR